MIVVADAGPLNYLVLIDLIDVLKPVYDHVVVPQIVAEELRQVGAPDRVRKWITNPPDWCEVVADLPSEASLEYLDPGERAAIGLALSLNADRLLIDEWAGRVAAERRHLHVTGTLGVLAEAHRLHLLDFETAFARLRQTSFYVSETLIASVRRQLSTMRDT